jgi:hypothetical protein
MPEAINIIVYSLGWILFVAAQAQNSAASKTNGLPTGAAGIKAWLKMQAVNLATRAFFSMLAYGFLIHAVAAKLSAAGVGVTTTVIAGVAGYSANALLYQFFGLMPWLRVEVSDLAPPPNSQVVPPATGTNPQPLPK